MPQDRNKDKNEDPGRPDEDSSSDRSSNPADVTIRPMPMTPFASSSGVGVQTSREGSRSQVPEAVKSDLHKMGEQSKILYKGLKTTSTQVVELQSNFDSFKVQVERAFTKSDTKMEEYSRRLDRILSALEALGANEGTSPYFQNQAAQQVRNQEDVLNGNGQAEAFNTRATDSPGDDVDQPSSSGESDRSPTSEVAVLPAVINQINPPSFDGDRSKARSWLKEYSIIMDINSYSDKQKLIRARAYMKGDASSWINTTIHLNPHLDWTTFKDKFLRQFCGADGNAEIARRLDTARQRPDEHPSFYMCRIIDLCIELDPKMTEAEMLRRVSRGLREDIVNHLYMVRDDPNVWSIDWLTNVFSRYKMSSKPQLDGIRVKPAAINSPKKLKNLSNWTCANCNVKGHIVENCPQPKDDARIEANKQAFRLKKRQEEQNVNPPMDQRGAKRLERSRPEIKKEVTHLPCDDFVKPRITVKLNGTDIIGRVDTGADMTIIPQRVARKLELNLLPWDQPPLVAANNSSIKILGTSPVLIQYGNIKRPLLLAITPDNVTKEPLWGNDLLQTLNIILEMGQVTANVSRIAIKTDNRPVNSLSIDKHPVNQVKLGDINTLEKEIVSDTLLRFADTFSRDDHDIGRTSTVKHRILLTDDIPVCKRAYKTPIRNKKAMEEGIDRMIATGAIRSSTSSYASPVFFVDKDHGKGKRLVADFRALNAKTIPDKTPMPLTEDVFSYLKGMRVFAKLDISSMFNQIEIDERDIYKTAIITPMGLFECPLMPFGLMNAPATAVRLMEIVLKSLNRNTCFVYFDDIIVYATTVEELMQRCSDIFDRLRIHNLKLKPSKCTFAVPKISFLGYQISTDGIQIDPTRFEKVVNFPIPRNSTDVRSFYGLCSFNRKFIKDFASIAKPLTPLMSKNQKFIWTSEAQLAFENLKEVLVKAPVLVHFDPEATHELRTDASSYAIGAILYQKHEDPKLEGVVLYYSKTLSETQRRYSATERELLAAFSAITELQHYLFGKKFILCTDHQALSLLRNHKDPHNRIARWVAQLQGFDFEVCYKRGIDHKDADCMSRFVEETSPETVEVDKENAADLIRSICPITSQQTDEELENDLNADLPLDIRFEQEEDEYCSKYIRILENPNLSDEEKLRQAKHFTMQNDALHRIQQNDILLVIPARRRAAILLSCHDIPLAGHLGFQRTYSVIRCRFYWPKMRKDIKKYCASCVHCQKRKASTMAKQGLIQPLPIAEEVFDTLGLDLMTKLPKTSTGYTTILVCVDHLSKYVIAVPMKDEQTETILHTFFTHVIAKHGCPKLVVTDRASNLTGERSRDFFRLLGIRRKITSPYHPQSNGQTERFMRTLASSMTAYVSKNQKNWSDYVAAIAFAYNVSQHTVTCVTPYEIVFGKKPRLPIDNLLNRNELINPINPSPDIRTAIAMQFIKDLIVENQEKNKERLDKHLRVCSFDVGDLVLFARPTRIRGGAGKLCNIYVGPFKVTRKCGDSTFEISTNKGTRVQVAHSYNLRKFIPRDERFYDEDVDVTFHPSELAAEQDDPQGDNDTAAASEDDEEIESPDFEPIKSPAQL